MNSPDAAHRGGYRALSFQAEYIQEGFRISGARILVMYGGRSVFLAMLQKVLPRCVVAGPRANPRARLAGLGLPPGPSNPAGRARQPPIPRRLARLPHPGEMTRCRMRTITLRDANTTKVAF
jgi:hypothetical protein